MLTIIWAHGFSKDSFLSVLSKDQFFDYYVIVITTDSR